MGSEMCIRDRVKGVVKDVPAYMEKVKKEHSLVKHMMAIRYKLQSKYPWNLIKGTKLAITDDMILYYEDSSKLTVKNTKDAISDTTIRFTSHLQDK